MAEVNVDDCFIDHCDSAENHIGSSAVERARVLMQHIRASNDTFPTSSNQMNCKSIDDNFATNEYLCDASPPNKLSGKPSETKKTTNWLDVLKVSHKNKFNLLARICIYHDIKNAIFLKNLNCIH